MSDYARGWFIWNYEVEEWMPLSDAFTEEDWEPELPVVKVEDPSWRGETHTSGMFGYLLKHEPPEEESR